MFYHETRARGIQTLVNPCAHIHINHNYISTRVTNSQLVLANISQLRNAVLPMPDDHLRHLNTQSSRGKDLEVWVPLQM